MCGLAGYKVLKNGRPYQAIRVFEAVLLQSQIRGRHATGVAYVLEGEVHSVSLPVPAKGFLEHKYWDDVKNNVVPRELIAHCRYSTSGKTNQPIQMYRAMALVHNGLVSMGTKQEFQQKYAIRTETDCDSEIILQKVNDAYEGREFEAVHGEYSFADAVAHGLQAIRKVDPPIFACGFLDSQGVVTVVRDHLRPLWFYFIKEWGVIGFASTRDIIDRAFKALGNLPDADVAIWQADPYHVYTLGAKLTSTAVPMPGFAYTPEVAYKVPPLVTPELIDNRQYTLRGTDVTLDSPKYTPGDGRLNMRESFKRYTAAAVWSWEIDPNYPLMKYLFDRYELSKSQQYWACFLYGVFYHPGTVFYVMQEFPEYEKVDVSRLEAWHAKNWRQLRYNKDRKYEKGHFVSMFLSYREVMGSQTSTSQERFFERHFGPDPVENFHSLWRSLGKLLRFGRYSNYIYTETLARCMGLPIQANTIFLKESNSPRAGLCHVLGRPDLAKATLTKEQWEWLDVELEKLMHEIQEEYYQTGLQLDHWFVESCLCAFKGFFANGRYLGYYLDRMADEILQMQQEPITDGCEWNVLWQFRKESFPWEYLGEYGKPSRLKVQTQWRHTFAETGNMIGMWPMVKRGILPDIPLTESLSTSPKYGGA